MSQKPYPTDLTDEQWLILQPLLWGLLKLSGRGHLREVDRCELATRLNLAEGTVKNYVTNILQKIGARDRAQAALRA